MREEVEQAARDAGEAKITRARDAQRLRVPETRSVETVPA
jgi:hypothetical protein